MQRSRGCGSNGILRGSNVRGRCRKKRFGVNGRNATSSEIVMIAFDESKRKLTVANVGVVRGKNVVTATHVPDPGPGPLTALIQPNWSRRP